MSNFYIKNKKGEFVPIVLSSIINKDLNNRLVIVKVGDENHRATENDLDRTEESFAKAEVINDLDNVSLIITPYQVNISVEDKSNMEDKNIYIQISSGDDITVLEEQSRKLYKKLKRNFENVVILPSPLKLKDYRQVKEVLKRCKIRRERRARVKG